MCGIVGIFRKTGIGEADRRGLKAALRELSPRGPDGEGLHETKQVLLGHRLLAILDPEHGAQPWEDPATGVVLTYNGEIYNYGELRALLEERGHRLRTGCDTEVLMAAWLEWGEDCLERLNGMFAFAVLDPRSASLWLVRDRLGVKPLYFRAESGGLAMASSVAALMAFPGVERTWDWTALSHYFLTIRTTLHDRTLIRGIRSLPPGHRMRLDLGSGGFSVKPYWRLPLVPEADKETGLQDPCLEEELRQRFDGSVRGQLISDVPLGGFLSGGLDSSVLAAAILQHRPLEACSVGYSRKGYNEWEFVRQAAAFHGIPCEEIDLPEGDYPDDWRRLVRFKGLPLSTPNEVPISRLAGTFRRRFTVAMTGEGADEVFGGYVGPTFCAFDYDRAQGLKGGIDRQALRRFYGTDNLGSRREHFFAVNAWLSESAQQRLLPGLSRLDTAAADRVRDQYDTWFGELENCSTLDAYLRIHARVNLEGLLNRLDSSTMAASVEGRVPFTDHHLVEWAFGLPDRYKLSLEPAWQAPEAHRHWNSFELQERGAVRSKHLLRTAFRHGVPPGILGRPKMSFPVPFQEWFNGFLKEPYREALGHSPLARNLLSAERLEKERNPAVPVDGMLAWPLMNLMLLEEAWQVSFPGSP